MAIKRILKPSSSAELAKRTFRELSLLMNIRHSNVRASVLYVCADGALQLLSLRESFISPSLDLYMVTDQLDADLHYLIRHQPLQLQHVQVFLYQILCGVKYLHSASLIHRDLKPSNILVNENCQLKICDFGLGRIYNPENAQTDYVTTRHYRAPEIMLAGNYDCAGTVSYFLHLSVFYGSFLLHFQSICGVLGAFWARC